MPGHREDGSHDAYRSPVTVSHHVEDVLDGGKSQTHAHRIYDAVEVFVKMRIFPHHQPQCQQFETLFGNGCHHEGIHTVADERRRLASLSEEEIADARFYKHDGNSNDNTQQYRFPDSSFRLWLCVLHENVNPKCDGGQYCHRQCNDKGYHLFLYYILICV